MHSVYLAWKFTSGGVLRLVSIWSQTIVDRGSQIVKSFAIVCDRNVSHNILNSDPRFNASLQESNCLFVVNMAGVEQRNVSNEKCMEEVAWYQCVYHRNSKDFKDKNKKANYWEKIGEKFNLSAAEAEVKFRNIRTPYGRYLKRLKLLPSGSGRDAVPREFQNRLTKRRNKFACSKISSSTAAILFAAIFPPAQRACNVDSSAVRNVCNSRLCDRLRSSAIVCDHMETSH